MTKHNELAICRCMQLMMTISVIDDIPNLLVLPKVGKILKVWKEELRNLMR